MAPLYMVANQLKTFTAEGIATEKVRAEKKAAFGYNAQTDTYEDLVEAGVIDPTKVVRTALQNAASIAGLLLTTEAVVVEIPDENEGGGSGGQRAQEGQQGGDSFNPPPMSGGGGPVDDDDLPF